jgi:ABC-type transporter Mla MlaB component
MAAHYALEIRDDRSIYTLSGELDARAANALWRSVHLEFAPCERLVVDLRRLRSCHHDARAIMVEVHRIWAERARHIAYLSTDARLCGLSLWIIRAAGDETARALGSESQLQEWVGRSSGRVDGIRTAPGDRGRVLPPRPTPPSPAEWSSTQEARWAMQIILGMRPPWFDDLVRTHGFPGLKRWSDTIQRSVDSLTERHGELSAQTLLGLGAFWNGCLYCARGHLLAANLLHFESTGRMFPLSEEDVLRWRNSTQDAALAEIEKRFQGSEREDIGELVLRQGRLALGQSTAAGDEATIGALAQAESAWAMVNACPRAQESARVPPLHPRLSRDRQLLERYRQARRETSMARAVAYGGRSLST